ncbi:hypothetical protein [Pedobacter sp. L105]|uniref:hypothetical protein n=1 Tax=Pedobacter sp. L105 TaxID=1641871 RepID=UPI00131D8C98|nr:hypothetical protein [Pedobacter sp. L105]
MITPEENAENEKDKKTVYKETTTNEDDELTSGETSSTSESGRSAFSHTPERKNKPMGAGHEPGVTPGRDF